MATVSRYAIWTLYFVVFVDLFQVTFVYPFVPQLVEMCGHDKSKQTSEVAMLSSIAAIGEMVGSPILGWLSDKFGRRPVLLVSTLGSALSAALLAAATGMPMLIFARAVGGLSGGTVGIANTYLVDVTTAEERPGYASNLTAFLGLGLAVGPVVGGWMWSISGIQGACVCAALVSAANFACIYACIRESNPGVVAARDVAVLASGSGTVQDVSSSAQQQRNQAGTTLPLKIWCLFVASAFQSPIMVVFDTFSNLYITDKFYAGDEVSGTKLFSTCMSVIGMCLIIIPFFLYQPLLRLLGLNGSIVLGGIVLVAGLAVNGAAQSPTMFVASTLLWASGFQLMGPVVPILIGRLAPPSAVGKAFGIFASFGNASRVVGPAALFPVYDYWHPLVYYLLSASFTVVVSIYLSISMSLPPLPCAAPGEGRTGADPEAPALATESAPALRRTGTAGSRAFQTFGALPDNILFVERALSGGKRPLTSSMLPPRSATALLQSRADVADASAGVERSVTQ